MNQGYVKCLRIASIPKTIANSPKEDVVRHFDAILAQLQPTTGEICKFQMWEFLDPNYPNALSTVAWLQLKDPSKYPVALVMLNGAYFHQRQLEAAMAWYSFNNMDITYVPRAAACASCEKFAEEWRQRRSHIMKGLFDREVERLAAAIPEHKHHKFRADDERDERRESSRSRTPWTQKMRSCLDKASQGIDAIPAEAEAIRNHDDDDHSASISTCDYDFGAE